MKHRVYLFMTVLLVILAFSLSEAGSRYPSAGAQVGPNLGSVTIPAKNDPSIAQRMALKIEMQDVVVSSYGKKTKSTDESTSSSSKLPKKDTTQTPGRKKGDRPGSITILK